MISRRERKLCSGRGAAAVGTFVALAVAVTGLGAISGTRDAGSAVAALSEAGPAVLGGGFEKLPPDGDPVGTFDSELAVFPLAGDDATILSTGSAAAADDPDVASDEGSDNGGGGGGHGRAANDLVTLRVDLEVPAESNCLSFEFRFLSEEFPEFIGSDFNDAFVAELDANDFEVTDSGTVKAPSNFAFGPDGSVVTVNSIGTSADNALGTTYDGATPILRASTPLTPGFHSLYLTIYDASDSIYDSAVLIDNLRLRTADPANCTRGSAPNDDADDTCLDQAPTVFASDGVATGSRGDDVIQGSDDDDLIRGKGGDDLICAGPGDDSVRAGKGKDRVQGNTGSDELMGGAGKDRIDGNRGGDEIFGQDDGDRLKGSGGKDLLVGGGGGDFLSGGRGGDDLLGNGGRDELNGDAGFDKLDGGGGKDKCDGGPGRGRAKRC